MRDDRHADAGSSHVGRPAWRDSSRISSFAQIHFVERAADAELARRLAPGPIVAAVVGVVAVDDDGAATGGDARQVRVELVLAVVAAVRRVRAALRALELAGLDDLVPQTEIAGDAGWRVDDDVPDSWGCRR
mgnify:CR=1 FL=1